MRDIVLALFIFGTIPFILSRPYIGLLVWSWIGYMNPHRLTYGFAYGFPWVQLIAVVTLISLFIGPERKKIPRSAFSVLTFLFLVWTGIATLFAAVPHSAFQTFQEFAKTLVMVFVTLILVRDRLRLHWLVWIIVLSLGFYGVKGGVFTLLGGGASHVVGPPGSFIADNNAMALALCMIIPLMRYLQLHSSLRISKIGLGAGMVLCAIAVLGTYSRGGLIGLTIVGVVLFVKSRRRLALVMAFVAVGATAYHFMPPRWVARMGTLHHATETDSGETRIQSWKFSANVALHHPLLGGGFNVYESPNMWNQYAPEGSVERAVHSIYFRVLGEQGFPGLFLFLTLLVVSWRSCSLVRKRTRDLPKEKWAYDLASMLQVALVAFASSGAFLPMTYFDLTWQLMALCALLELRVQESAKQLTDYRQPVGRMHVGTPAASAHGAGARV